jgi:Ca-activated chloride channel family protein
VTFRWPLLLWLCALLVPLSVAAYVLFLRRRAVYARMFASPHMVANVVSRKAGWRAHVPFSLYLLAAVALAVGLARPLATVRVPREQATVLLVMDNSNSMRKTDVDPSRLGAARAAALTFLELLPEEFLVGVIGFDREARVLSRPTTDRVAIERALVAMATRQGTAIGSGVQRALDVARPAGTSPREAPPTVLLLLSDGNNNTGLDPHAAALHARRSGIPVVTVALGRADDSPSAGLRPPNFRTLGEVARAAKGRFFTAPSASRLETVYRDLASRVAYVRERREISAAFLAAGAVLLVVGGGLSSFWFHRLP